MRSPLKFVGIIAVLLAASAAAGPKTMSLGQAMKASADPRYESMARKADVLARDGDAAGLANHLATMKAEPGLADPARERLLHDGIMAAAGVQPDAALENQIRELGNYESQTLIWTDEHGYREVRPLYDFTATTRYVRRAWSEDAARSRAARSLAAGDLAVVATFARASDAEREGAVDAVREAPPGYLAIFQPALMSALDDGEPVGMFAAAVAARTRDVALMSKVLAEGAADAALLSIREIQSPAWGGESVPLLVIASARDDVGSAAVLALGRLAATEPDALNFLFRALGAASGPSAAAALARLGDDEVIARLSNVLGSQTDEATRRHALLGLRLSASQTAAKALADFAHDPEAPPRLVAEVPTWLRD